MKDQIWFFARASRNILDQHVTAGLVLEQLGVKRVLVGDAGALVYAGDVAGIDLIGLGGFRDLPFARSTVQGLGASLELIERMAPHDRPDAMAIYPSWWGDLPHLFGRHLTSIPVHGNVICGGAEKAIYRADWSPLDRRGQPRSLQVGEQVVDEVDLGDLLSERAHGHNLPRPNTGFVRWRLLADPAEPQRDLFDAGRIVPAGFAATARMAVPPRGGRLVVRLAPDRPEKIAVSVGGRQLGVIVAAPIGGEWSEHGINVPAGMPATSEVELRPEGGEAAIYHLWMVE